MAVLGNNASDEELNEAPGIVATLVTDAQVATAGVPGRLRRVPLHAAWRSVQPNPERGRSSTGARVHVIARYS